MRGLRYNGDAIAQKLSFRKACTAEVARLKRIRKVKEKAEAKEKNNGAN